MDVETALLLLVLVFAYMQFFIQLIPVWVVYLIIFTAPIIRLVLRRDYHLFSFDITDTMQSVTLNSLFAIAFIIVLLFVGFFTKRTSIITYTNPTFSGLFFGLMLSFFQELFFRYYLQETLQQRLKNTTFSVALASLISASFFLPNLVTMICFFIMGLFFGWIYDKTKDIYGITIGHFIISLFLDFVI